MTLPGSTVHRARATPAMLDVATWPGAAARIRRRLAVEWTDPESRVDLALAACSLLLGLFSLATLIAVGYLNHTTLPWFDGWEHWIQYVSSGWSLTFLFSQHTEHRIPVSRLLYLADEKWFGAHTWFLLWCTFLAQLGSAVMLYRLAFSQARVSLTRRVYLFGVILALLFSASQWINFTWTFQVCFVVVFSAAIAALVALKNSVRGGGAGERAPSTPWVAVAIVMGLISTGSMANGLLVWPLLVMMAGCVGLPRKVAGTLAVVGAGVTFAYLYGYQPRSGVEPAGSWTQAPKVAAFALAYLGSALDEPLVAATKAIGLDWQAYRVAICALAGLLGIVWLFDLLILTVRDRARQTPAAMAMLHVIAFLVASSALTAIGRVQVPMEDALTSRYATPSVLFWAALMALTFSASPSDRRSLARVDGYRLRVAVLLAAAFVGGLVQLPKVAYAADSERFLREGESAIVNRVFAPEGWQRFLGTGSAGRMIPVVRYFREHRLVSFTPDWTRWIGDPAAAHFRMTSNGGDCIGAWESVTRVGGSFNPAALVAGWGYDRRFKRAPEQVVFTDGTRRIAGFGFPVRRRPDLDPTHPEFSAEHVGWQSFLPAGLSSEMTAYIVLGDGRTLCRAGAAHIPGTYLTAPAAKAGEIVAGVDASAQGTWIRNVRPGGTANPPFATDTWSSHALSSRTGVLRFGPVKATGGVSIGLPLLTGPGAKAITVSAIDRGTGEVLAVTNPPAGTSTWDLWRLDIPTGASPTIIDYVIEQGDNGDGKWIVAGLPRLIQP